MSTRALVLASLTITLGSARADAPKSKLAAKPETTVFRQYDHSDASPLPPRLVTYTLVRDGDRVTLRAEQQLGARKGAEPLERGPASWKPGRSESYVGSRRVVKGAIELDLVSTEHKHHLVYRCTPKWLAVAPATAVRVRITTYADGSQGKWSAAAKLAKLQLCVEAKREEAASEPASLIDHELVFTVAAGVEHVRADDQCCKVPGAGLRWIARDGAIAPLR